MGEADVTRISTERGVSKHGPEVKPITVGDNDVKKEEFATLNSEDDKHKVPSKHTGYSKQIRRSEYDEDICNVPQVHSPHERGK